MQPERDKPVTDLGGLPKESDLRTFRTRVDQLLSQPHPQRRSGLHIAPSLPDSQVFDVDMGARSELYAISEAVAKDARAADLRILGGLMQLQPGHNVVDVGAGTGFVAGPTAREIQDPNKKGTNKVFGFETSREQLRGLVLNTLGLPVVAIEGSFGDDMSLVLLGKENHGKIDVITTMASMHHATEPGEQERIFANAAVALKPGSSFVGGDVGDDKDDPRLKDFFMKVVKKKCITGHVERWLSRERLEHELLPGTGLELVSAETHHDHKMVFESTPEMTSVDRMVLWAQAMLALRMDPGELKADLGNILGYKTTDNVTELNWPLFFFKVRKPELATAS